MYTEMAVFENFRMVIVVLSPEAECRIGILRNTGDGSGLVHFYVSRN